MWSVSSVGATSARLGCGLNQGRGSTRCTHGSTWGARESVARMWAGPIGWLSSLGDESIGPSPKAMNTVCVYIYVIPHLV
jgi:hypothetical protein